MGLVRKANINLGENWLDGRIAEAQEESCRT
jgi:hypothetical protein